MTKEQRHLTDEQFDALWQRAESAEHATRLSAQYPAWRAKQRRAGGLAVMTVALLAVVTPVALHSLQQSNYQKVYCNRDGISNQEWADLASTMLLES